MIASRYREATEARNKCIDQCCRPGGPPGLLAEGTSYSARDQDSGSTVSNLLDTVAVSRSVTDAPGAPGSIAGRRARTFSPGVGGDNETLVPSGCVGRSLASAHQSGTDVPGVRTHHPPRRRTLTRDVPPDRRGHEPCHGRDPRRVQWSGHALVRPDRPMFRRRSSSAVSDWSASGPYRRKRSSVRYRSRALSP